MKKYYLYRHIRLDKNEPFYIGIGSNTDGRNYYRAFTKTKRSEFWERIVALADYEVEILFECDDYSLIINKEKEFITLYGRKDKGLGPLCNLTDGGEGSPGSTRIITDWQKQRISIANTGRPKTKEQIEQQRKIMTGKKHSKEAVKKRSQVLKNRVFSEETKRKISQNRKGKGKWVDNSNKRIININTGDLFNSITAAAKYSGIRRGTLGKELKKGNYMGFQYHEDQIPNYKRRKKSDIQYSYTINHYKSKKAA